MGMCANLDVEVALSATYFKREKRDLEHYLFLKALFQSSLLFELSLPNVCI